MGYLLRFGVFELNLVTEELRKFGTTIKLPPQPFKVLALLASQAGQVVTREQIQFQVWGGETYVDFEHGLNQCIKQIRTALNDNADKPVYLETIPRHGYRFLAPVRTKTVPVPPPQVKEASSDMLANVSEQVRARVQAATQGTPADPRRQTSGSSLPHSVHVGRKQLTEDSATLRAQEGSPNPLPTARSPRVRRVWGLLPLPLLLAVLLYWFLSRAFR